MMRAAIIGTSHVEAFDGEVSMPSNASAGEVNTLMSLLIKDEEGTAGC